MCGLVGIIDFEQKINPNILRQMRDTLIHRGPDDAGIYISSEGNVGLGSRRLSIIDLSPAGHQPMSNVDETIWIAYNGEIYNFLDIRSELERKGYQFRSKTDTEVIIYAYQEWGEECVNRFRGMFAFVLWDARKQKLFLCRDRFGIKPLFYYWDGKRFICASEIKAILVHPLVEKAIDLSAIWDYLTYRYIPTPKTAYKNIRKLPPAHTLSFENGRINLNEYWDLNIKPEPIEEAEAAEMITEKIRESVKLRLIADVPLGVFLSGGLDSSAVTATIIGLMGEPVKSFSIGFEEKEYDELKYANIAKEAFKTDHYSLVVTNEMVDDEFLSKVLSLYDEPFADSSAIPTYFVSKLASEQVKVALSGDGGDEVFAGYTTYDIWLGLRRFDRMPFPFRKLLGGLADKVLPNGTPGKERMRFLKNEDFEQYCLLVSAFSPNEKASLLKDFAKEIDDYDDFWYFRKFWREDLEPVSRVQYLDMKTYLHDDILTKVDRASMASSLEVRVPFLDHELVEAVMSLPPKLRYIDGVKKYILKKAMANRLPQEILNRSKKGFGFPLNTLSSLQKFQNDGKFINFPHKVEGKNLWTTYVLDAWLENNGLKL